MGNIKKEVGGAAIRGFPIKLTFPEAHPRRGRAAASTDFSPVCLD